MQKQNYLKALLKQNSAWILKSALSPNDYMTKTHIKLHYIALKMKGQ
jgi:hypothetical protein